MLRVPAGTHSSAADQADPIALPAHYAHYAHSSDAALPFNVVNLRYDLTPIGNISVVATETGLTPPTSIPVLMREMQSDLLHTHGGNKLAGTMLCYLCCSVFVQLYG